MSFLAAAACLAAGPLSAQVRIGVIGETGLLGVGGAPAPTFASPLAPAFSPTLSAASVIPTILVSPAAPVPAARPAAALRGESVGAALEALAPDKIGRITGESAKGLSARLLGLDEGPAEAAGAEPTAGRYAASVPDLGPSAPGGALPAREPRAPEIASPAIGARPTAADRYHYVSLLFRNYYWYSVTHIVDMWPSYRKSWEEAKAKGAANVSRPRAFFAHMRVAATSGRFYVLGSAPLEDDGVIAAFRQTLVRWYDAPGAVGPAELAAFDAFTARAKAYNAERRAPSNMRKHVRDALIKGATMEPAKLASYFDSLLIEETSRETSEFQNKGAQKRILDAFKKELLDTLAEEPAGAKGRIRAAILLGSFATGSAGPKSDFDVEMLSDGADGARTDAFVKRMTDRWSATGRHARNPVTFHDVPSTPTRGIIDLVHTGDFLVISHEPALVSALQRMPGDYTPPMIRKDSVLGKFNRAVQYGVIIASTYAGELKQGLR